METHSVACYSKIYDATYFHCFDVGNIPKEVNKFIGKKDINVNIFSTLMLTYFTSLF